MPEQRVGIAGPRWGTGPDPVYGIVDSEEKETAVEESNIVAGDGDIIGSDYHGKIRNYRFDFMFKDATGLPGHDLVGTGTLITLPLTGDDCRVVRATETYTKAGYRAFSLEARGYPDLES